VRRLSAFFKFDASRETSQGTAVRTAKMLWNEMDMTSKTSKGLLNIKLVYLRHRFAVIMVNIHHEWVGIYVPKKSGDVTAGSNGGISNDSGGIVVDKLYLDKLDTIKKQKLQGSGLHVMQTR
jgi:hypothetical protein